MKYLIPSERSDVWQQHSPYEACSASYMALAPSVHIATHFGQGISCSRKKLSITLKTSELFFTSRQAMGCFPNILNISLAAGNIKLLKLARQCWLIVSSRSAG